MADQMPRDDVARALRSFGDGPIPYQTFARTASISATSQPRAPQPRVASPPAKPSNAASSRFPLLGSALPEAAAVEISDSLSWQPRDQPDHPEPVAAPAEPPPQAAVARPVAVPPAAVPPVTAVPAPQPPMFPAAWAVREPPPSATHDRATTNDVRSLSYMFRLLGAEPSLAPARAGDAEGGLGRLLGSL